MNGLGDSIGTMIEGGLLGRAVEPGAGEASAHTAGPLTCANCSTRFEGHFCRECGQKAHVHRSLAAIGHDILHGVLHLDGKLWRTLPLLTLKPGELTRRYIAGERAKFVSPMAMFLFTVFAMFAVFQMVGISTPTELPITGSAQRSGDNLAKERAVTARQLEAMDTDDPAREATERRLRRLEQTSNDAAIGDQLKVGEVLDFDVNITGIKFLDQGIIAKWQKNPSLMFYKLQSNGYKFSWLLIPLSVPFLWLMFAWRRQFKAYDHAVFATYSLSFMSLLFITMSIIGTIPDGGGWAALLFTIGAPLHLYKQLRYAYGLTRPSALWRFAVLVFCIQIVLLLFLQALLVLGAF